MSDPPPPAHGLTGLADRVLAYADRPWRVGALIVLAAAGGLMWFLWEQRAELAQAVLQKTVHPRLVESVFPGIARTLTLSTGASFVMLAAATPEANIVNYVAGLRTDEPAWSPPPGVRPLWTSANASMIIEVIEGHVVCIDVREMELVETRRDLADAGVMRACLVAVPAISDVMVGVLVVGWKVALNPDTEAAARQAMRRAALKLADW